MTTEFDDLESHDHRQREDRAGEYWVAACGSGQVSCYRKGMTIIDFYRNCHVLASVADSNPVKVNPSISDKPKEQK